MANPVAFRLFTRNDRAYYPAIKVYAFIRQDDFETIITTKYFVVVIDEDENAMGRVTITWSKDGSVGQCSFEDWTTCEQAAFITTKPAVQS